MRRRTLSLALFATLIVGMFAPFATWAQYYLAPYVQVYPDLLYLQSSGWLQDINWSQQPITLAQLQQALHQDFERGLLDRASPAQLRILRRLVASYLVDDTLLSRNIILSPEKSKPRAADRSIAELGLRLEGNFYSSNLFNVSQAPGVTLEKGFYPQLRTFGLIKITPQFSLVNVMAVDPYASQNPRYLGKEWRGLSGYTEQAYFLFTKPLGDKSRSFLNLTGGRSYIVYGPGRTGQLLLSSAARPLDNCKVEILKPPLGFQSVVAKLDESAGNARYLSLHRLSLQTKRLDLSLSEVLLYGGKGRSVEWAYLNPLLLFHGENVNGPALNGNTLGTLDWRLKGRNWQFYGELLIDDIQFDKKEVGDLEPNEWGLITGVHLTDPVGISGFYLGTEIAALTNRTYKTVESYEWYLHRNVPLGYAAGSDLLRWNLQATKYFNSWRLDCHWDSWWRGEGELTKPWDSPWDTCSVEQGYREKFPTGRVEKINQLQVQLSYLSRYDLSLSVGLGWQMITNKKHSREKESSGFVTFQLYYFFRRAVSF